MIWSKAVVTGGAGFIGSNLVDSLVAHGTHVTVLDNFTEGTKKNLSQVLDKIKLVKGDVRNKNLVNQIIRESPPEVVFHLAANASVPKSVQNPLYDFETNVVGTFNLLHALKGNSTAKVVFASSAAIYGESMHSLKENDPPNPISPYGSSKLCGELLGLSFKRTFGSKFTIARIFNVYGPRLPRYVIFDFYKKLKANPTLLEVLGSGKQVRQFCYVSDAVKALILIAQKGEGIYNIAGNETISVEKLAEIMISKVAPKAKIQFTGSSWLGDIENLIADISELQSLGFKPRVNIKNGIDATIDWFDEHL